MGLNNKFRVKVTNMDNNEVIIQTPVASKYAQKQLFNHLSKLYLAPKFKVEKACE